MIAALYAARSVCAQDASHEKGRGFAVIQIDDAALRKLVALKQGADALRATCQAEAGATLRQVRLTSFIEVAWVDYNVLYRSLGEVSTSGMSEAFVCIGQAGDHFPAISQQTRCALPAEMIFDGETIRFETSIHEWTVIMGTQPLRLADLLLFV